MSRRYKDECSKSKSRKRDKESKASSAKGKQWEQSRERSHDVRDAHPRTSRIKAESPPSQKQIRERDHSPARFERDPESRSRSPALIRCDASQGQALALFTLNAAQKKMRRNLGIESATELSLYNHACAAGHALSHVTLDVFTTGAGPKCNISILSFSPGASAWTCYRCVQSYLVKLPIPNGIVDRNLKKGFALCVQCAYSQPFDVDSQDAKPTLTWAHSPNNTD